MNPNPSTFPPSIPPSIEAAADSLFWASQFPPTFEPEDQDYNPTAATFTYFDGQGNAVVVYLENQTAFYLTAADLEAGNPGEQILG